MGPRLVPSDLTVASSAFVPSAETRVPFILPLRPPSGQALLAVPSSALAIVIHRRAPLILCIVSVGGVPVYLWVCCFLRNNTVFLGPSLQFSRCIPLLHWVPGRPLPVYNVYRPWSQVLGRLRPLRRIWKFWTLHRCLH